MMRPTLQLFGRPAATDAIAPGAFDWLVQRWVQSTRAMGGYWQATGEVMDMPQPTMISYFNRWLGNRVISRYGGRVAWDGIIYDLRLALDGVEYRQTLDADWFHNYVVVNYSSDVGERVSTSSAENLDSQEIFGLHEHYISIGGATAAGAAALRDRHIIEFGWPRSRMSGGIALGSTTRDNGLYVTCAGFWATLNWKNQTTSLSGNADTLINTLVSASEFVSAGRIESNSLSVRVDADPNPARLGDAIIQITEQGDGTDPWKVGVYEDRVLDYMPQPGKARYYLRGNRLLDLGGREVVAPLLKPGFFLFNGDAPGGWTPPGSEDRDDPRVAYVDEVEYARDTGLLTLSLFGQEESVITIQTALQRGSYA